MVIGATRPRRARVASASTPRPAVGRSGATPLVDAAFACLAIATAVWYFHLSRGQSFHHDDWQIVQRYDDGLASLFRPHNGHLSLLPLLLYRLLFGLVGLRTYTPFRALGLMCLVAMAAAVYCLARARVGAVLALVAGIGVLWLPGTRQFPFLLNFYIPLTAAVVCAAAMTWTRRYGDIAMGAALTVALCSSAVGVSVAVACIVHAALARARWRRWIAILLPMSGWAVWWLTMGRHSLDTVRDNPFLQLSIGGRARLVWRGIIGTFDVLAAGRHGLGIALAVLFAGFVVWRVASRSSAGIGALAWSAAVVAWWVGVVESRSWYGFDAPRYRHVAAVFVVLAVLPPSASHAARRFGSRLAVGVAAVGLVAALTWANRPSIVRAAESDTRFVRTLTSELVVANLGPSVVPDGAGVHVAKRTLPAGTYRRLAARFGPIDETPVSEVDRRLVALGAVRIGPVEVGHAVCTPLTTPFWRPAESELVLSAGRSPVTVRVRRFGPELVTAGVIPADHIADVHLPGLGARVPWEVQALGGCARPAASAGN